MFRPGCEYLSSARVVRPGAVHLLEHVATARIRARVEHLLTGGCMELDELLVVDELLGRARPGGQQQVDDRPVPQRPPVPVHADLTAAA